MVIIMTCLTVTRVARRVSLVDQELLILSTLCCPILSFLCFFCLFVISLLNLLSFFRWSLHFLVSSNFSLYMCNLQLIRNRDRLPFASTWIPPGYYGGVRFTRHLSVVVCFICLPSYYVLCPVLTMSLYCPLLPASLISSNICLISFL